MKIITSKILLLLLIFSIHSVSNSQTVLRSTISVFHSNMNNDTLQLAAGQILTIESNSPKILHGYYPLNHSLLSLTEIGFSEISIYPNPFSQKITLTILKNNSFIKSISIYDLNGKLVLEKEYNSNTINVNLNQYNNGIYFVKIIDNNGNVTAQKIIKS